MGETAEAMSTRGGWPFAGGAAVAYAAVTVLFFADVLFSNTMVLSAEGLDLTSYYLHMREYGFGELARGRLPLWNPHTLGGTPFAANVQSALFYPPNWIYLVLPAVVATNVSVALHFFLAAWFTALWAHARTGMAWPALLAGLAYACSGGYFLHLHPGHLTILCAGVWTPLLLRCTDAYLTPARERVRWVVLGAVAVGMPVLAGHPQVAYYAYIGAGLYLLAHLSFSPRKGLTVGLMGAAILGGVMLSAVQLLPSYALAGETTRAGGLSRDAASAYALPVENLLTAFLPHVFGSAGGRDYFGRWFVWEVSLFVGVVPAALAVYGGIVGARGRRVTGVIVCLLLLAGVWPGLHEWLQRWVPGFATFRAAGRFGMVVDVLLAVLAADGLAALVRRGRPSRGTVGAVVLAALAMVGVIVTLQISGVWRSIVGAIAATGQSFVPTDRLMSQEVLAVTLRQATVQSAGAGTVFVVMAAILFAWRRRAERARACVVALVLVGAADLLWAAYEDRSKGAAALEYPAAWARAIAVAGPGERVVTVDPAYANVGMSSGFLDVMGYDSTVLARYVRFLAISQGENPRAADAVPGITRRSGLLRAVRARWVLHGTSGDAKTAGVADPLPRFHWVHRYEVHAEPDGMYAALGSDTFDPAELVLLESEPVPAPHAAGVGASVRVVRESAETIEVEATTPGAAILVMTDAYARGWRVVPVAPGGPQGRYEVLPADLTIRAIPLAAGTHRLRIEYVAPMLAAGAWVSGVTLVGLALALVVANRRRDPRR
jgi:hypothetical protein